MITRIVQVLMKNVQLKSKRAEQEQTVQIIKIHFNILKLIIVKLNRCYIGSAYIQAAYNDVNFHASSLFSRESIWILKSLKLAYPPSGRSMEAAQVCVRGCGNDPNSLT